HALAHAGDLDALDHGGEFRLARRKAEGPGVRPPVELYAVVALKRRAVAGQRGAHALDQRRDRTGGGEGEGALLLERAVVDRHAVAVDDGALFVRREDVLFQAVGPRVYQAALQHQRRVEHRAVPGLGEVVFRAGD